MYCFSTNVGAINQSPAQTLRIQLLSIKIGMFTIYATCVLFSAIKMGAFGLEFNLANHFYELFLKS